MNIKDRVDKTLLVQPSNEKEARDLLIAIINLEREISADIKKDITPHYNEIEKVRVRHKKERVVLYQKRTHAAQELIRFIEDDNV